MMKKTYLLVLFNLVFSLLNSQTITISSVDTASLNSLFFQKLYQIDIEAPTSDSIIYYEKNPRFQIKVGNSSWYDEQEIFHFADNFILRLDTMSWERVFNSLPFYFNDSTLVNAIEEGENKVLVRFRIEGRTKNNDLVYMISNIDTVYIHPLTASEIEGYHYVKNEAINIPYFSTLRYNFGIDIERGPIFVNFLVNNFHNSIWNEIGMYYRIHGDYTIEYVNAPGNILSPTQKSELIDRLSILRSSTSWIVRFEAKLLEGRVMADGY